MDEFRALAIEQSVNKLFTQRYFCICDFDKLAKLLGVAPNHRIRQELSAFHCVDYSEMADRTKELIQQKVVEALRGDVILNPALVLSQLTTEGRDFAFTEDRYIDSHVESKKETKKSGVIHRLTNLGKR